MAGIFATSLILLVGIIFCVIGFFETGAILIALSFVVYYMSEINDKLSVIKDILNKLTKEAMKYHAFFYTEMSTGHIIMICLYKEKDFFKSLFKRINHTPLCSYFS